MTWTQNDAQFWAAMARSIERGGHTHPRGHAYWGRRRGHTGLCYAVLGVYWNTGMPQEQYRRLSAALQAAIPKDKDPLNHWFPLTPKGDQRRAALCRRLARKAARDGGNHGGAP